MPSNVRDWNGITHKRRSRAFSWRESGLGLGVEVACGKVYDDRKPDMDFEARGEVDCMACVAEISS